VVAVSGKVLVFDRRSGVVRSFSGPGQFILSPPAIGDVDGDGRKEIILARGTEIFALNSYGVPIDYFPIKLPPNVGSSTAVVLARLGMEKTLSLFLGTSSGLIFGFDARGRALPGFPLAAGDPLAGSLALFHEQDYLGILGVTPDRLYAWAVHQTSSSVVWGNTFGDPLHSGFEGSSTPLQPVRAEFLPADRAYNWPNPVYGASTRIRYYLNTSAEVKIKIFDLAGDKVAEFAGPGIGGIDNEMEWDVSDIQSGIYIARIEANGSAERAVALVKIAVVK